MSVIVPVYGTAAYVAETLDSILAQTFTDYEVLVVNDGSPDTELLERVLEPYREHVRYLRQENRGVSGARNAALRAARGRYVALLDSDDRWHPDYLAGMVAALERDPGADVVYPDALRFGDGRERRYSERYPLGGEITFARLLARECHVYGGATVRRRTLVEAGMYDEEVRGAEDFDLWLRILRRGGRIVYVDRVLAYYRVRPGSHTADGMLLLRNLQRVLDKVAAMELLPEEREIVERQRAWTRSSLNLAEGMAAFRAGDLGTAERRLRDTGALSPRRRAKIAVLVALLRVAPRLARQLDQAAGALRGRSPRTERPA